MKYDLAKLMQEKLSEIKKIRKTSAMAAAAPLMVPIIAIEVLPIIAILCLTIGTIAVLSAILEYSRNTMENEVTKSNIREIEEMAKEIARKPSKDPRRPSDPELEKLYRTVKRMITVEVAEEVADIINKDLEQKITPDDVDRYITIDPNSQNIINFDVDTSLDEEEGSRKLKRIICIYLGNRYHYFDNTITLDQLEEYLIMPVCPPKGDPMYTDNGYAIMEPAYDKFEPHKIEEDITSWSANYNHKNARVYFQQKYCDGKTEVIIQDHSYKGLRDCPVHMVLVDEFNKPGAKFNLHYSRDFKEIGACKTALEILMEDLRGYGGGK